MKKILFFIIFLLQPYESRSSDTDLILKKYFLKETNVFGVKILGLKNTPEKKIKIAKSVLKQWLDNNNDNVPDNKLVVEKLIENNCSIVMGKSIRKIDNVLDKRLIKEGVSEEQVNGMFALAANEEQIAYLEEILHMITSCGYAYAYPNIFGEYKNTKIALAMDKARGGYFEKIPNRYSKNAWYTYNDKYCDYSCMITEYFYWSLTSYIGIQKNRLEEISDEWKLNTKKKMKKDVLMMKILLKPEYKLPKLSPKF